MQIGIDRVATLAREWVGIDSRSFVSNLPLAERIEALFGGFEVERIDYADAAGVEKRALVAARGRGGLAFSGHMDTVPDTGWSEDPWSARTDQEGRLYGLGSTDMKGPLAAATAAALALPAQVPVALLITTDEETTKEGARRIAQHSELARRFAPRGILVAEPTGMVPVRGHRSHIAFTAVATGVQAHSSTGEGRNANWALIPFLQDMKALHERLRTDTALQDPGYDPPFSDFNLVIDNHGAAVNVTVPVATARIKFRYSASVDPTQIADAVAESAARHGIALDEAREGRPPELPADHWLIGMSAGLAGIAPRTAPYGTDASELQVLAPCVVLGPGEIGQAHKPQEHVRLEALAAAVPTFMRLAEAVAEAATRR